MVLSRHSRPLFAFLISVVHTSPSSAGLTTRSKITQNFLDPIVIANPYLVFAPRPPATQIDDKGYYFFNRLSLDEYVQVLTGVRKSDYRDTGTLNAVSLRCDNPSRSPGRCP
jgi:hypothetical protein